MPKHFFFDLDNTLTPSRASMHPEHADVFRRLCERFDVTIVTGGAQAQIQKQIPFDHVGLYYMLSQQGNYAVHKDGRVLWHETVTPEQESVARSIAEKWTKDFADHEGFPIPDPKDWFENRGSQLAASVVGFHAPNAIKYKTDPDQSKRRAVMSRHPEDIATLHAHGLDVMPAGTTTYDFILHGKHKGYNIVRLKHLEAWPSSECLYVGDALFPGGNDESVIGVIPTHAVTDPRDTVIFMTRMLS